MISKDTFVLLRLPFSLFLLPVFLFAWSQTQVEEVWAIGAVFGILHLLIYPASNGYNSWHDQDEDSIGGLKAPPKPQRQLLYLVNAMDLISLVLAFTFFDFQFMLLCGGYILASRLYSHTGIRIKKYPVFGFIWVSFFQGYYVFWLVQYALGGELYAGFTLFWQAKICASLLLGAVYPLTQIYQHEADKRAGVRTISMLFGYRGTFFFTAFLFAAANVMAYFHFVSFAFSLRPFWVMQLFFIPVTIYFLYWFVQVWKDTRAASFNHAMRMNLLASLCMNLCFTSYLISL